MNSGPALGELPANTLTGEPASRGFATGRARRIDGELLPSDIAPGDILVAPFARRSYLALHDMNRQTPAGRAAFLQRVEKAMAAL